MSKTDDLKAEYLDLLKMVNDTLDEDRSGEVLSYFTGAILRIWGSNDMLYSEAYAEVLSAVREAPVPAAQIITAMDCCSDPKRKLLIPAFFQDIVRKDVIHDSSHSADFIEKFSDFLFTASFINGDFTIEETNSVSSIIFALAGYCRKNKVRIDDPLTDFSSLVTERDDDSYLKKTPVVQESAEKAPVIQDSTEKPTEITANILPVIIVSGDDSDNKDSSSAKNPDAVDSGRSDMADPPAAKTLPAGSASEETLETLLDELDGLVGLDTVKRDVHSLINFIKISRLRASRGMKVPTMSYHLVFTGNPGTGKTTVARLVAKLYYHMGILPQGQLVEADRSTLVAGYLGQTAIKTQKVIQEALGGVLFIDEAYSLANDEGDSYGKEAIETILKAMEDHRDELVVIVAGYDDLMHKFIDSNPGLASRFSKYFNFPDYSGDELTSIFTRFCSSNGYRIDDSSRSFLHGRFSEMYAAREEHFGNARTARNIFEKTINCQADRLSRLNDISDDALELLTQDDIDKALGCSGGEMK